MVVSNDILDNAVVLLLLWYRLLAPSIRLLLVFEGSLWRADGSVTAS